MTTTATPQTKPVQGTPAAPTAPAPSNNAASAAPAYPSADDILKVIPDAKRSDLEKYLPTFLKCLAEKQLTSANQLIAIFATVAVETGGFDPTRLEDGNEAYFTRMYENERMRKNLGNTQPGDGPRFRGRGLIQITGRTCYRLAGKGIGVDLESNPELARDPVNSCRIFAWFWSGGNGSNKPFKFAETGDWLGARKAVNGGTNGLQKFYKAIERAKTVLTKPLDAAAIGPVTPPSENLGCVDTGGAGSQTLSLGVNPQSQKEAVAWALGLMARDRARSHELRMRLNVAAQPDVLKLEPQTTFEINGVGAELDGTYTVQDTILYPLRPRGPEMLVIAFKPDPNAPPVQVFNHDPNNPNAGQVTQFASAAVPAGEIPTKIYQAGLSNKGKSSAAGPDGGNQACAWSLGKFCILPAGLQKLGDGPFGSNAVAGVLAALAAGRGRKVPIEEIVPGDIWADAAGCKHIGIFIAPKGARVLSNSSSNRAFMWEDSLEGMSRFYKSGIGSNFWRVLS